MADIRVNNEVIADIGLLIFDKDGTLMELHYYWTQMVGLRAALICENLKLDKDHLGKIAYLMGADLKTGRLRPDGPVGLKKREIVLQTVVDYLNNAGYNGVYDLCFNVFQQADDISSKNLQQFVRPIDGAERLLRNASRCGCKTAIATIDRRERAILAMKCLGFADIIDLVVGADDVSRPKPDPEQINFILNALAIDRSNAIMVGDAMTDVQMGVNAGLKVSIGVLTGLATKEQLKGITPYVVEDVSKIEIVN
ncbi:MAG: HAD hydrolase-like protein [Syntrophorhabdaceae bacterium]|nr:HAD hydrolase-like protein [Syntrophorhabdaceae bacterium]MDD5242387.1 HAD hydrolase-like protein [Syntrophorhabdaceae bacterium]